MRKAVLRYGGDDGASAAKLETLTARASHAKHVALAPVDVLEPRSPN